MYQNHFLGNMPTCNICYMPYPTFVILGEHIISAHAHQFRPLYDPLSKPKTPPQPYSIEQQFGSQFLVKEEPKADVQRTSPHQISQQTSMNQYIKCPLCQFVAISTDMLQTHINSEHMFQNKVYSDLKPVNLLYNSAPVQQQPIQILNLLSYDQQHQQFQNYYGPISVSPPKNVIDYGNSSLSITPVQSEPKNLTKGASKPPSPEQQQQPEILQQQQQNLVQGIISKVNLLTVDQSLEVEQSIKPRRGKDGTQNGEKNLKCDFCFKDFRRRDHLNKHVLGVHCQDKQFVCLFCHKKYSSSTTLKQHVNNSHSQKMLACQYCDKSFARNDHMLKHVQGVHLKERKYLCEHCPKGFTSHGALLQHVGKSHTEKNFHCQKCSRKFVTLTRLQLHIQDTSSLDNEFVCQICDERFASDSLLLEHCGKSHKMKSWKCDMCPNSFKGKYILQAHLKKIHGALKTS